MANYIYNLANKIDKEKLNQQYLLENKNNNIILAKWILDLDINEIEKKKYYYKIIKNLENEQDIFTIKHKFYNICMFSPEKYNLTINEIDNFQKDYEIILNNIDFLKNNYVYSLTFHLYSNIKNLYNIKYLFPKEEIELWRKDIFNIKNKKIIIAFLCIPIETSPVFFHFIKIYYYLSKLRNNIILILDNNEEDLNEFMKFMLKDLKIIYIKDLDDNSAYEKIKFENIDILISQYGHYKRLNILKMKPCKILINSIDGGFCFPTYFMDYNLSFNKIIKESNEFKFIQLKNLFPIFYKSKFKFTIVKPKYNNKKIKIGLIITGLKISKELLLILKKLLENNNNILLTIYSFNLKDYLKNMLNTYDEEKLIITTYDNSNNYKLKNNLFYLDTFFCNNHSTAGEIISSYRPILTLFNKNKLYGQMTYNIIKNIKMEKELSSDNIDDYYNLVMKYINSESEYYKMYYKFINNIKKYKIIDNKAYAKDLYNKLIKTYNNHKFKTPLVQLDR
jgi:predicted O-linked N-acetylglucosamine transferase (SPINDLY family)